MSFEDDLVLVDNYTFDEATFLKNELKAITTIFVTKGSPSPSQLQQEITNLGNYTQKINQLVAEYKQKTLKPKNIAWTLDDQDVLDLYQRLLIHKDRLDIFINRGNSNQSLSSGDDQVKLEEQKKLLDEKTKENQLLEEKLKQQEIQIQQLQNQTNIITATQIIELHSDEKDTTVNDNDQKTTDDVDDDDDDDDDDDFVDPDTSTNVPLVEVEPHSPGAEEVIDPVDGKKKWAFLPKGKKSKYLTPKAIDYEQLKHNYIEQLIAEIDRLTLLGQKHEAMIIESNTEVARLAAENDKLSCDNIYFEIVNKHKDTEIETLNGKLAEWELYATQQENEVKELNEILFEQFKARTFAHVANNVDNTTTTTNTTTTDDTNNGNDADTVDNNNPSSVQDEPEISTTAAATTTTGLGDDDVEVQKVQDDQADQNDEANQNENHEETEKKDDETKQENIESVSASTPLSEETTTILAQEEQDTLVSNDEKLPIAQETPTSNDVVEETSPENVEQDEQIPSTQPPPSEPSQDDDNEGVLEAAREIAAISKAMLESTQSELDELKIQKNDLQEQLNVETTERRKLAEDLFEERDQRRQYKLKLDTTQAQVVKFLAEIESLQSQNKTISGEKDELLAQYETLRTEHTALVEQRDELLQNNTALTAEKQDLLQEKVDLIDQNDALQKKIEAYLLKELDKYQD